MDGEHQVIIREYRDEDEAIAFKLWKEGFYEMRQDGFEWLSEHPVYHLVNLCLSYILLHFLLGFSPLLSLAIPLSIGLLDRLTSFHLYTSCMRLLHGFLFWHAIDLIGRKDMKSCAAVRRVWMRPSFSNFWVAEVDGNPVGCVACKMTHTLLDSKSATLFSDGGNAKEASVWRLSVDPSARRYGLGRRLMATAERWAGEQGARRVSLITGNKSSKQFYQRIGYLVQPAEEAAEIVRKAVRNPVFMYFMLKSLNRRCHPEKGTLFYRTLA